MLTVLEFIGVGVFASSGALAAGRKHLDLLGVIVIAVVTATGGGTLRDLLLDRHPIFWIEDPRNLFVTLGAALLTVLYTRFFNPPHKALLILDALGLALFSIGGAQIAEDVGVTGIVVVVMGTLTGVAGGMLRDIILADIPVVLRRGRIYATAAIVGILVYLGLQGLEVGSAIALPLSMAIIAALRFAAIIWGLRLPIFSLSDLPVDQP
ncbi:MAG: trimeric intracellular cation channel family protein [Cyanobacteria bacterium P01_A01_bin.105]